MKYLWHLVLQANQGGQERFDGQSCRKTNLPPHLWAHKLLFGCEPVFEFVVDVPASNQTHGVTLPEP